MSGYADFVNDAFAARESSDVRKFWIDYLRNSTSAKKELPADTHTQRISKYMPGFLPDPSNLAKVARQHGVSVAALFLCTYARTYAAMSDHQGDSLIVGIYIANRAQDLPELETFPTLNLLPIRVDLGGETFAATTKIQNDLRVISEMGNVSATLGDIYKWTGVEVSTFVNWAASKPSHEDSAAESVDKFRVRRAIDDLVVDEAKQWATPKELRNVGSDGYKPVIDVEVALRNNALDVGLFCPTAMLERKQAESLLETLKRGLLQL